MANTITMESVETRYRRPLREVVLQLYSEHQNMATVADILGVSRATLWTWRMRIGLTALDLKRAVEGNGQRHRGRI